MPAFHLKLVWGSRQRIHARWRLGLFGYYTRTPGFPDSGLAISMRGLVAWLLGLSVCGYLAAAAALARWLHRDPYNQVGFVDVLTWPARRAHVAELRGRGWLIHGKEALANKRWNEAFFLLRRGLDSCPGDLQARMTLAQFYILTGQRPRALKLLVDGLDHATPEPAMFKQMVDVGVSGEDWDFILLVCDRCLPRLTTPAQRPQQQQLLAAKRAALVALGRAQEALALAEAAGDAADASVKTQRLGALLALGRKNDAVEYVAQWRAAAPKRELQSILFLQARMLREAGRLDEMEAVLAELRALNPASHEPLAFGLVQRALAGRAAEAALDDYLFRFGGSASNLIAVSAPLAEIPAVPLVQRIVAAATERGYDRQPFRIHLTMALLRQGDWPGLARVVDEFPPQLKGSNFAQLQWLDWIRRLSEALAAPLTASCDRLEEFLQGRSLSLEVYRSSITALRRAGRADLARRVVAYARRSYEQSPWLRTQQEELEREAANAPPAASPVVAAAPAITANWREFFRALDDAIGAARWDEARKLITRARSAQLPPAWLAAQDASLLRRELRVYQALGEVPALRFATRMFVDGSAERSAELLTLAREWHAAGDPADALILVKTVLEKTPRHAKAAALLAEWQPPPKPATP